MSPFDTFVAVALTLSVLYSIYKGMVREVFSLLAYLAGYLLAIKFQGDAAASLNEYIPSLVACKVISFAGIFLITTFAVSLIGRIIRNALLSSAGLSGMDRVLGGGIGLAKGWILLTILVFPMEFFPDFYEKVTRDSRTAPYLEQWAGILAEAVGSPEKMLDRFPKMRMDGIKENFDKLKDLDLLGPDGSSSHKVSEGKNGPPQDDHTEKDKKELKDLLSTVVKE